MKEMEKKKVTIEELYNDTFEFEKEKNAHWAVNEQAALELAQRAIVVDGNGAVYRSYRYSPILSFVYAKYCTNIDTDELDTEDGQNAIWDYLKRHEDDYLYYDIEELFLWIYESIRQSQKAKHSVGIVLAKYLDGLADVNSMKGTMRQAEKAGEKMLSVMEKLNEAEKNRSPIVSPTGKMLNFSKK